VNSTLEYSAVGTTERKRKMAASIADGQSKNLMSNADRH
jgi:hypothetical protein